MNFVLVSSRQLQKEEVFLKLKYIFKNARQCPFLLAEATMKNLNNFLETLDKITQFSVVHILSVAVVILSIAVLLLVWRKK